jgi:sporulation protein YlmC with PRC-barrel domain
MSEGKTFYAALEILDHLLVDLNGRHCGCVDDLELELEPGGEAEIVAILAGPGARPARAPGLLGAILRRFGGEKTVRLPWARVVEVTSALRLNDTSRELGLEEGERRPSDWIARLPGS